MIEIWLKQWREGRKRETTNEILTDGLRLDLVDFALNLERAFGKEDADEFLEILNMEAASHD